MENIKAIEISHSRPPFLHPSALVLSNHLLLEYEEVLKRNAAMLALTQEEVDRFPNAICRAADRFQLPTPQTPLLRLAETSRARLITTHNIRHLRPARAHGVTVLPPREFLRIFSAHP